MDNKTAIIFIGIQACGKSTFYRERFSDIVHINLDTLRTRKKENKLLEECITPVSNILKSKRAYRGKEAKASTFFDDMQSLSKAAENNSCQIVIPITKRDC